MEIWNVNHRKWFPFGSSYEFLIKILTNAYSHALAHWSKRSVNCVVPTLNRGTISTFNILEAIFLCTVIPVSQLIYGRITVLLSWHKSLNKQKYEKTIYDSVKWKNAILIDPFIRWHSAIRPSVSPPYGSDGAVGATIAYAYVYQIRMHHQECTIVGGISTVGQISMRRGNCWVHMPLMKRQHNNLVVTLTMFTHDVPVVSHCSFFMFECDLFVLVCIRVTNALMLIWDKNDGRKDETAKTHSNHTFFVVAVSTSRWVIFRMPFGNFKF